MLNEYGLSTKVSEHCEKVNKESIAKQVCERTENVSVRRKRPEKSCLDGDGVN